MSNITAKIGETFEVIPVIPLETSYDLIAGSIYYQWQHVVPTGEFSNEFVDIVGANSPSYTISDEDAGKTLILSYRHPDANDDIHFGFADATIEVESPPASFNIVYDNLNNGSFMNVNMTQNDPDNAAVNQPIEPSYQWQKKITDYAYTDVLGQTQSSYLITIKDTGATIRCQINYTDANGYNHTVATNDVTVSADQAIAASLNAATDDLQKTELIVEYTNRMEESALDDLKVVEWSPGLLQNVYGNVSDKIRKNRMVKSVAYKMSKARIAGDVVSREDLKQLKDVDVTDIEFRDGDVILGLPFSADYSTYSLRSQGLEKMNFEDETNLSWGGDGENDPQSLVQTLHTEKDATKTIVVRVTSYDENDALVSGQKNEWQHWVLHIFRSEVNEFTSFKLIDDDGAVIPEDPSNYEILYTEPTSEKFGRRIDHRQDEEGTVNVYLIQKRFTTVQMDKVKWENVRWLNPSDPTLTSITLNVSYDSFPTQLASAQFSFKIVPEETGNFDDIEYTDFTGEATGTSQSQIVDLATYLSPVLANTQYMVRIQAVAVDIDGSEYTFVLDDGINKNNTTFTFTTPSIADEDIPVITLIGDETVYVAIGDDYTDAGAVAVDVVDGVATDITADKLTTNLLTDPIDTSAAGTYTVRYNALDAANNAATEVTRDVIVENQTPHTVTLEGPPFIHQDDSSITFRLTAKKQGNSIHNLEFKIVESGEGRQSEYVVGTQVGDPDDKMYEAKVTLEKGVDAWDAFRTFTPHVKDGDSVKTAPGKAQSVTVTENVTNSFKQQLAAVEQTANARGNRIADHFRTANDSALNDLENETIFTVPGSFKQASDGVTDEPRRKAMKEAFARDVIRDHENAASREDILAVEKPILQRDIQSGTYFGRDVSLADSAHIFTKRPRKIDSHPAHDATPLSSALVERLTGGQKRLTIQTTMTDSGEQGFIEGPQTEVKYFTLHKVIVPKLSQIQLEDSSGNIIAESAGNYIVSDTKPDVSQYGHYVDHSEISVTVSDGKFYFNEVEAPVQEFARGQTYVFDVSDASNANHPLEFVDANGYTIPDANVVYSSIDATVTLVVPSNMASYKCQNHEGMGNNVSLTDDVTKYVLQKTYTTITVASLNWDVQYDAASAVTSSGATLNVSYGDIPASVDTAKFQYNIDGGVWQDLGSEIDTSSSGTGSGSATHPVTGLSSGTAHSVQYQVIINEGSTDPTKPEVTSAFGDGAESETMTQTVTTSGGDGGGGGGASGDPFILPLIS